MALDLNARLTLAQAEMYFQGLPGDIGKHITKVTITGWYNRGLLRSTTVRPNSQRLYLLRELLDAERDTRRSPNSSRSLTRRGIDLLSV